jgi:hypothetical protein
LRTDDRALIYVQNRGVRHGPPEVLAALAKGQAVSPDRYYMRTTPIFESAAPRYGWLNDLVAVPVHKSWKLHYLNMSFRPIRLHSGQAAEESDTAPTQPFHLTAQYQIPRQKAPRNDRFPSAWLRACPEPVEGTSFLHEDATMTRFCITASSELSPISILGTKLDGIANMMIA